METFESLFYDNVKLFAPILVLFSAGVLIYNWRRRWLYYYASKIPGPFALPLLGSFHLVSEGPHGVHKFLKNLFTDYPSTLKVWLGPELYVSTTEPEYLKLLLTRFLDKGNFYHLMTGYFQRALAAAPVKLWKKNRKNINPTFNITLINSFVDIFSKHAKVFTEKFKDGCGKETDDIYPSVWECTLDAGCETLADVSPSIIKTQQYLSGVFRIEEILMKRFFHPLLHFDIFWNLSPLKKELNKLWKQNCSCMQKMIDLMEVPKTTQDNDDDVSTKKRFLTHLIDLNHKQEVPHDYVLEESQIMFFVGTETSAVVLSSTLLVLGMYPDVQKKIEEELISIFGDSDRDPSLEDVNQMQYLERVIKETMRLLPPIPFVMRSVDENVHLGPYVFPKDARVIIPIAMVHRRPEFWPNPEKFDPDRFLPEEAEKRPVCSYIPFSYGVRNCIGYKYGLLSMKIILSTFLRSYRIKSSNYKSIQDMDLFIHVVAKPKNGYKIVIEKKQK
ncbi:cytochrome P450 4C1-like isoform X1 [Zophobas morio]|uniref:cytochrome P450 4C1-like isoform X1 n=1 Tax=Zophobas morio TaxID=2755281 RepID=UPI0030827533